MTRLKKAWQPTEEGRALATELHLVLEVSHRQAKGLIDAGCVKIGGESVHIYGQRLKPEDHIAVEYDPGTVYQTLPQPRKQLDKAGFKILWEDQHLLFVDKPAGLLTVPSEKGNEASLAEAITDHYRTASPPGCWSSPRLQKPSMASRRCSRGTISTGSTRPSWWESFRKTRVRSRVSWWSTPRA